METVAFWTDRILAVMSIFSMLAMAFQYWWLRKIGATNDEIADLFLMGFKISMFSTGKIAMFSWTFTIIPYSFFAYYGKFESITITVIMLTVAGAIAIARHFQLKAAH